MQVPPLYPSPYTPVPPRPNASPANSSALFFSPPNSSASEQGSITRMPNDSRLSLTQMSLKDVTLSPRLQVGDTAPNFTLNNQNGQPIQLYEALQKGPVVLFFYPKDNSYYCTQQAQKFKIAYPDFLSKGASVFGISNDSEPSHQQFAATQNLPYPLLSDPGDQVRKQYGAQSLGGLFPGRVTYVVAPGTARVQMAYSSQTNIDDHIQLALKALNTPSQATYPGP